MQPSMQAMEQAEAPLPLTAKASKSESALPLLSLLTFSPMGNPLVELTPGQCNLFFDYLLMSLHRQRKEQLERTAALAKKIVLPASLSASAMALCAASGKEKAAAQDAAAQAAGAKRAEEAKWEERQRIALEKADGVDAAKGGAGEPGAAGASGLAGIKFSSIVKKGQDGKTGGEEGGIGPSFSSAFGQRAASVSGSIQQLSQVIGDYARGSAEMEGRVVGELHGRMRAAGYRTDDIMASLLMVIEDDAWAGEEGGLGTTHPHGGATRLASLVPQKLKSSVHDSSVVRLASVREMLRYYFLRHPQEYSSALASALGMASGDGEDTDALQEKLAYELASIGGLALAQKLLAEIKKKKKLDTSDCLLRLGYKYDAKKKRLIMGKRTCGKPAEARGIIGLLLASARHPSN